MLVNTIASHNTLKSPSGCFLAALHLDLRKDGRCLERTVVAECGMVGVGRSRI